MRWRLSIQVSEESTLHRQLSLHACIRAWRWLLAEEAAREQGTYLAGHEDREVKTILLLVGEAGSAHRPHCPVAGGIPARASRFVATGGVWVVESTIDPSQFILPPAAMEAEAAPIVESLGLQQDVPAAIPPPAPCVTYSGSLHGMRVHVVTNGKCRFTAVDQVGPGPGCLLQAAATAGIPALGSGRHPGAHPRWQPMCADCAPTVLPAPCCTRSRWGRCRPR